MVTVPRDDALTIDELARRVDMTVRNIRAHQSRGLLPPPVVRGRTGYYGPEHVARLELIKDMQADGFNLRAIRHVIDRLPPGADAEMLSFRRAVAAPWTDQEREVMTRAELRAAFQTDDDDLLDEAVRLGLLVPLGEDRYEVVSPSLLEAGAAVVALGVPPNALVPLQKQLLRHADGVARVFVDLYLDHVWRPFVAAGAPEDRWPDVRAALDAMQPLASQSLDATFRFAMERLIEQTVASELSRDSSRKSPGGRARGRRHRS